MIYVAQALNNLRPNSHWTMLGDDYDAVTWLDENESIPSREEVDAEILLIKQREIGEQYKNLRLLEYPKIQDQLDMLYHDIKNGNLENGNWIKSIKDIKTKYPKP